MADSLGPHVAEAQREAASRSVRRIPRRLVVLVASALVIAVGAFLLINALGGDDEETESVTGVSGDELSLEVPDGWTRLSGDELESLPGDPLAVFRREDGEGLVIVNAQRGRAGKFTLVARQLDRRLERRIPDFRKVRSRTVRVEAGTALLYSYARRRRGTAHTLIVVPAGDHSYTINAAVPAGSQEAAQQAGKIIFSFDR